MLDYILNALPFALLAGAMAACIWVLVKGWAGDYDVDEPGVWDDARRDGRGDE